jgi:glycosyltransferase involved in cell wall biosynthesis
MVKHKVLITSPSLYTKKNIGGISNLTRLILDNNKGVDYIHFVVGKEDNKQRNHKWFFSQFKKWANFHRTLKKEKIEVVHINMPLGKYSIIINFSLIIIATLNRKKIVVHLRGGKLSLNNEISIFQKFIIKNSLRLADKVLVLGEKEREFTEDYYVIPRTKIKVLPNAVVVPEEASVFKKLSSRNREDCIINILFIGRIDKNKGLKEIVETFKNFTYKHYSFQFILAGTGPDQEWFIGECKKLLDERFHFLGVVDYNKKNEVLMETDIFILPSYFEGLPNGLLENMSFGSVPICTPVGAIPEVIIDKNNGFIIEKNSSDQLISAIELLINDKDLRFNLGMNAYNTIRDKFSLDSYIKQLNAIYNELKF